jgi:hypothetical protein
MAFFSFKQQRREIERVRDQHLPELVGGRQILKQRHQMAAGDPAAIHATKDDPDHGN